MREEVSKMIKIAVCDDEKYFVDQIRSILVDYGDEIGETIYVEDFYSGISLIENYDCKYDMIFLDIKMPSIDGVKVAEEIRKKDDAVTIIFLTSLMRRAVDGYKVGAANFLIKPVERRKIIKEIDRWQQKMNGNKQECILVENITGQYRIPISSLRYIETYNRNLLIHSDAKSIVCCNKKLKELKEQLGECGFAQSHKGFIINLSYVDTTSSNEVTLVTKEVLPISRAKKKEFMSLLARFWGERL